MLAKKEIDEILKIKGRVRGVVFHTDVSYVFDKKGEKGVRMLKEAVKKAGLPISYDKEVRATRWYPLSWRVLSLLTVQRLFNWDEKEIFEMGYSAPRYSFIVKTLLRYFISLEKTFTESAKYWREHYSIGELEATVIDIENKHVTLRLKDFKTHPIFCSYLKGYFKTVVQLTVKAKKMTVDETKCVFKGDPYHEFVINWQ